MMIELDHLGPGRRTKSNVQGRQTKNLFVTAESEKGTSFPSLPIPFSLPSPFPSLPSRIPISFPGMDGVSGYWGLHAAGFPVGDAWIF